MGWALHRGHRLRQDLVARRVWTVWGEAGAKRGECGALSLGQLLEQLPQQLGSKVVCWPLAPLIPAQNLLRGFWKSLRVATDMAG